MTNETGAPAPEAPATSEAPAAQVDVRQAAIDKLQAALNGEQAAAQPEAKEEAQESAGGAEQEQSVQATQPAEAKADVPSESPEPEVPLTARQRAALFRQEQQLQKQRQALEQKEAELKTKEGSFLERLLASPSATLKEFGVENPADLATLLWNEALGDKAPAEYKQQAQARILAGKAKGVEKELETLPQKIDEAVQRAVVQTQINAKDREIQSFLKAIPEDMKFLNRYAQKNKEATLQAFYDVAMSQFDKGNFDFTAQDIARELNAEMQAEFQQFQDLYSSGPSQSESTPAVEQRQTTKTLMAPETVEKPSLETLNPNNDPNFYHKRGVAVLNALLAKNRK